VRDEETGLLVPPGDPDALAAAIMRLAADPRLRERLAAAGRAAAAERYSLDRSRADMAAVIAEVVAS